MKDESQAGLKYHWTNPKFEGKPWPTEKKPKKNKKTCVKRTYTAAEVETEVNNLRITAPELIWKTALCEQCEGWHVVREYPPGYVSEERKKAIALWKQSHGEWKR